MWSHFVMFPLRKPMKMLKPTNMVTFLSVSPSASSVSPWRLSTDGTFSKAGCRAVLTGLKRHWYERGECLFTVSLSRHVTPWVFTSLKSSSISLTDQRLLEWLVLTHSRTGGRREGRQIRFSNGFCEPGFQSPSPCSWQKHDRLWACRGWKVE